MGEATKNSTPGQKRVLNVIIFGPPGSGKGTQSDKIIEKYGLRHLSTGELIRKEIAEGSEIGLSVSELIANGQLIDDEIVINMVSKHLDNHKLECTGHIFDGFPRTLEQAEALETLCKDKCTHLNFLIDLEVPDSELIQRILKRGEMSGRSDDNLDAIQNRLEIYHQRTKPVIEYYESKNRHIAINGLGTVDEIFERIAKAVDSIQI